MRYRDCLDMSFLFLYALVNEIQRPEGCHGHRVYFS